MTPSMGAAGDRGGPGAGAAAGAVWGQRGSTAGGCGAGQEDRSSGCNTSRDGASQTFEAAGERENADGGWEGEVQADQEDASGVLHVARVIATCQAGGKGGGVCDVGMRGVARLPRQLLCFFRWVVTSARLSAWVSRLDCKLPNKPLTLTSSSS